MLRALYTAATGMQSQQINIDTIANNIANVNTTGFKQGRAEGVERVRNTDDAALMLDPRDRF